MGKAILSLMSLFLCVSLYAQTFGTGDGTLDAHLKSISAEAKKDLATFKANLVTTYGTSTDKVNSFFTAGMDPGDVVMAFEVMKITKKPSTEVIRVYKASKSKGWGEMAKQLGIKPGSKEFHSLKDSCGKNKDKVTKKKATTAKPAPAKKPAAKPAPAQKTSTGKGKKS